LERVIEKLHKRTISGYPFAILDAIGAVDDYYSKILEWSSLNKIGVALGNSMHLLDGETRKNTKLFHIEKPNLITSLTFHPEGDYLTFGCSNGDLHIWSLEKGSLVRTIPTTNKKLFTLNWNQSLLSCGAGTNILSFDFRQKKPLSFTIRKHTDWVCGLKWSDDGGLLASGGNDNRVYVWDSKFISSQIDSETKPLYKMKQHKAAVKAISWCPWKNNFLVTAGGSADKTIKFWDLTKQPGQNLAKSTRVDSQVNLLAFNFLLITKKQVTDIKWDIVREKELICSHGMLSNHLSVWDFDKMVSIKNLYQHTKKIVNIAQNPYGDTIASIAGDEQLCFWNIFEKKSHDKPCFVKPEKFKSDKIR
jgi:cell division cycle 20, cofactor of APC complex